MTIYFVITFFVLICAYFAQNNLIKTHVLNSEKIEFRNSNSTVFFLFLIIFILTFISGFRYYVGADFYAYDKMFYRNNDIYFKPDYFDLKSEPAFILLCRICGAIYNNSLSMFIVTSVITIVPFMISTYKENKDFVFVTAMYIFSGCWHGSFNGIRQYLAVTIIYLGRHYIIKRKFLKYLLVCFIAFLFHRSAMFAILFYFAYSEKFSVKRLSFIVLITIILSLNYETIFEFIGWLDNEEFILNDYSSRSVNILRILVQCCPAALSIYYVTNNKVDKNKTFYVYIMIINAAIYISMSNSAYLTRLGIYSSAFIPLGLNYVTDKNISIIYYKYLRLTIVVLYFIFWLYGIYNTDSLNNFRFVFNQ